jgi:hypothetical protein
MTSFTNPLLSVKKEPLKSDFIFVIEESEMKTNSVFMKLNREPFLMISILFEESDSMIAVDKSQFIKLSSFKVIFSIVMFLKFN